WRCPACGTSSTFTTTSGSSGCSSTGPWTPTAASSPRPRNQAWACACARTPRSTVVASPRHHATPQPDPPYHAKRTPNPDKPGAKGAVLRDKSDKTAGRSLAGLGPRSTLSGGLADSQREHREVVARLAAAQLQHHLAHPRQQGRGRLPGQRRELVGEPRLELDHVRPARVSQPVGVQEQQIARVKVEFLGGRLGVGGDP